MDIVMMRKIVSIVGLVMEYGVHAVFIATDKLVKEDITLFNF